MHCINRYARQSSHGLDCLSALFDSAKSLSIDETSHQVSLIVSDEVMGKLTHLAKEQKIDLDELINSLLEASIDASRNDPKKF